MNPSKRFCVVMWCDDCTGQDFEGCFEGLVDRLYFDTIEDARAYIQRLDYQEPLHAKLEDDYGAVV